MFVNNRVEVVAPFSQGRTAAAQCGLFTHKSVPVIFEPPCTLKRMWKEVVQAKYKVLSRHSAGGTGYNRDKQNSKCPGPDSCRTRPQIRVKRCYRLSQRHRQFVVSYLYCPSESSAKYSSIGRQRIITRMVWLWSQWTSQHILQGWDSNPWRMYWFTELGSRSSLQIDKFV
jgi:hypothetical protein